MLQAKGCTLLRNIHSGNLVAILDIQRIEGQEIYGMLDCTKDGIDKPVKYGNFRELEKVFTKAPSNGLLMDAKHIFSTLERQRSHILTLMIYLFLLTALIGIS